MTFIFLNNLCGCVWLDLEINETVDLKQKTYFVANTHTPKHTKSWESYHTLEVSKREGNLDYLKVYGFYVISCTCKNTQKHNFMQKHRLYHTKVDRNMQLKERKLSKSHPLNSSFKVDFTVNDQLIISIKKHYGRSKNFWKSKMVYPLFCHSPWSDGLPGPNPGLLFQILCGLDPFY